MILMVVEVGIVMNNLHICSKRVDIWSAIHDLSEWEPYWGK